MSQHVIQYSFSTGEWAPTLNARVDLARYSTACALAENYFVDYRGGLSTRPGTQYILQAYVSSAQVRLIPFQASFDVGYILEFGDFYIRFYNNGAPVLETAATITGATKANPCVVSVVNTWSVGDWVYITGVSGMTELNGRYFIISARTAGSITLEDLFGNAVNSSAYGAWTSGGTASRVYTLTSPYAAADLSLIKYAQNINTMVLCHPNYAPQELILTSAANWTIQDITFGATIDAPTAGISVTTTLGAGGVNYAYVITSVDADGQESAPSSFATLLNKQNLTTNPGTNTVSWTAVDGATSYNVYKSEICVNAPVPAGSMFGFVGNVTGTSLIDSNIAPDFSQTPPVPQNPFFGSGVASVEITNGGSYNPGGSTNMAIPTVTFAPPGAGVRAQGFAVVRALSFIIPDAGAGYAIGDIITFKFGIKIRVTALGSGNGVSAAVFVNQGESSTIIPHNKLSQQNSTGSGSGCKITALWEIASITVTTAGTGYGAAPAITFSSGTAAATAVLGASSLGNPTVPSFFQQRLFLAAPPSGLQTFYASQPGAPYNYDTRYPIQADDSITAQLSSGLLNEIKSMVSMQSGLLMMTSNSSWVINGGSAGSAISAIDLVANVQSYVGASDVPPIVANFDLLYVQAKGSIVRDIAYNFYTNVFTGDDITTFSSHLFFGYTIHEWAWAQEPFRLVWAVRNDGTLLSLTFMKEQQIQGWTHHVTEGSFESVASVIEQGSTGFLDAVYFVVSRQVNGQNVQYIERLAERYFPNGASSVWAVDAGLQYSGDATTTFTGGEHLAGLTVTGLADGEVIPEFTMPANGSFTLDTAASVVTVGIGYNCDCKTLGIDLGAGQATIQGKVKKISAVNVRVAESLGLQIGQDFDHLVNMKDLVVGNVSSMLTGQQSQLVEGLYTGDTMTIIGPAYTVPGQYCIRQPLPLPATILGVIPEITVGDTK